jgi:hypothetical protein
MKGFVDDIEEMTEQNSDFRRVLFRSLTVPWQMSWLSARWSGR